MSLTKVPPKDFCTMYSAPHERAKTIRRTREWTIPMLQRLAVTSGQVLSIGCASGADVAELRARNYEAYGIDACCDAPWCRTASATAIPFGDGVFDAALMLEVIEHIPHDERAIVARESMRVLKAGAPLIVATPNRLFPLDEHGKLLRVHSPFRDDTVSVRELESLFGVKAATLTWQNYFAFQRFSPALRSLINAIVPLLDSPFIHRSAFNPHLFVALLHPLKDDNAVCSGSASYSTSKRFAA